jgi:hypothetical protein
MLAFLAWDGTLAVFGPDAVHATMQGAVGSAEAPSVTAV